jgi:hypothetical protein
VLGVLALLAVLSLWFTGLRVRGRFIGHRYGSLWLLLLNRLETIISLLGHALSAVQHWGRFWSL